MDIDVKGRIAEIETLVKDRGLDVVETVLKPAGVHRKTWKRWKDGDMPTMNKWHSVQRVADSLKAD